MSTEKPKHWEGQALGGIGEETRTEFLSPDGKQSMRLQAKATSLILGWKLKRNSFSHGYNIP